jgi:hypothetical protein
MEGVETASPPARAGRRPRDMVRAMVVLMVPVILLVALYRFLGNDSPPTVDTSSAYGAARAANAFPVITPTGLDDGWHIATATYRDGACSPSPATPRSACGILRLGMTSPAGGALQLVESNTPPATLLLDELGPTARANGTVDVNGTPWQRYTALRPDEKAIVLTTPGRTIIVVGKADERDLITVAASLR